MPAERAPRADAVRNRARVLAAAADELAASGMDASVASIARRAGVGKGTVFRHFATRDDLIEAIAIDRFDYLTRLGEELATAAEPGPALMEFLTAVGWELQRLDLSVMQSLAASSEAARRAHAHLHGVVQLLLERAQANQDIRDDITATDLMLLMGAPVEITRRVRDADPDLWQRYLAIICDGLRPGALRALPLAPPPDPIRPPTAREG